MSGEDARYGQTLAYLFSRLPMFSRTGAAAIKKDLTNTLALCEALGNPHRKFRSIHVAGTNGKGSTSHALAAILQVAGYKTGLYTSPHLVDFRERIRIDGVPVSKRFVVDFTERVQPLIDTIQPSFFELTVAMAAEWFATQGVDIAVIETGLGGRLDSTNVITPELSVITHIALDHTDLLGDTLEEIAAEKAGIIKPGIPVVIGRRQAETEAVFEAAARRAGVAAVYAGDLWEVAAAGPGEDGALLMEGTHQKTGLRYRFPTDLAGAFQVENIRTALAANDVLMQLSWNRQRPVSEFLHALGRVGPLTGLRGRYEVLSENPRIIADVAHNPDGLRVVLQQFVEEATGPLHIVAGFVRDKDVEAALKLFPAGARYYWCNADIPRALPVAELEAAAAAAGLSGSAHASVNAAVEAALRDMDDADALLITGSFFVVGEALVKLAVSR